MCQSNDSKISFQIFKPLYILYCVVGINSIKFNGEICIPVGSLHKILCILVCTYTVFGISSTYGDMMANKYGVEPLKNALDSVCDIMVQLCVILVWIMSSFVSGKITVKMFLNYSVVESHLKVIQKWSLLEPPTSYLRIIFFHCITILVFLFSNIVCVFVFEFPINAVVTVTQAFICNLTILKFCTEIYVIILYIDKTTREIKGFLRCIDDSTEADNLVKSVKISNETNTLMQLYSKLSENCGISNYTIHFPIIMCLVATFSMFTLYMSIYIHPGPRENTLFGVVFASFNILYNCFYATAPCVIGELLQGAIEKLKITLTKGCLYTNPGTPEYKQFFKFRQLTQDKPMRMSAFNLFDLNHRFIISFAGFLASYTVILDQMRASPACTI